MHASARPIPGVFRSSVQRRVVGRSMVFGCPSGRGSLDWRPAERTQRSAPPPPCVWTLAGGCLWLIVQRGVVGRSKIHGCPLGRGSADESPAERTQRSAPPPPCVWALAGGRLWLSVQRGVVGRSKIHGCPSGRGSADESSAERTQRSALPSPVCWAQTTVDWGGATIGTGFPPPPPQPRAPCSFLTRVRLLQTRFPTPQPAWATFLAFVVGCFTAMRGVVSPAWVGSPTPAVSAVSFG